MMHLVSQCLHCSDSSGSLPFLPSSCYNHLLLAIGSLWSERDPVSNLNNFFGRNLMVLMEELYDNQRLATHRTVIVIVTSPCRPSFPNRVQCNSTWNRPSFCCREHRNDFYSRGYSVHKPPTERKPQWTVAGLGSRGIQKIFWSDQVRESPLDRGFCASFQWKSPSRRHCLI